MMKPKKRPALGGSLTVKRGINTIICCVLIMDHNCCNDADKIILSAMLPARTAFVVEESDEAASAS